MSEPRRIASSELQRWLSAGEEVALLDVREAGEFASGHALFASSLPFGQLEARLAALVPNPECRTVFMDDGASRRASRAARIASALGYGRVFELDNGAAGWAASGGTLFEGVFVPSKAFGEMVEDVFEVPHVDAAQLQAWQQDKRSVLILDGRPFEEHRKMNIPGSICLPNGELAHRIDEILPPADVPIVMHCAGRTRSIIGAQILRDLGVANPVFALQNGTQGWTLAGFPLEHGSERRVVTTPSAPARRKMQERAERLAKDWNVPRATGTQAEAWSRTQERTTYFLDVRSAAEFAAGAIDGFLHAPGGQLLQSTDEWLAARGARIVLADDTELRAVIVARWLRMMGWECWVLDEPVDRWPSLSIERMPVSALPAPPAMAHAPVPTALLIDTRASMAHRESHPRNARWLLRWQLTEAMAGVDRSCPIVLLGNDEVLPAAFAHDLRALGFTDIRWLQGGPTAWTAAGIALETTPDVPSDREALDFVFFTHDRHSGNLEAARTYLAWETGLVARLSTEERRAFALVEPAKTERTATAVKHAASH